MNWLLGRLRRRGLASEFEAHLEERVEELVESGADEASARRQARQELGNAMLHLESGRQVWAWPILDELARDFRYAARNLARSPLFSTVVVGVLAVGIGANVAVFNVVNAALLKPLPVREPDQLVRMDMFPRLVYSDYLFYRDNMQTLGSLVFHRQQAVRIGPRPVNEVIDTRMVSSNYFEVLGVSAQLGRTLTPEDEAPGAPAVLVISDRYFRGHFGSDPAVIGEQILVDDVPVEIVGVASRNFRGISAPFANDAWLVWQAPVSESDPGNRRSGDLIGRLEPGRSLGEAEAEFRVLSGNPEPQRIEVTEARTLPQEMIASLRGLGALLLGFVSLILVVTAANLGNLVLGRGAARTREIGTRLALGASRWKVVRLLMAESLLLALGGGVVAILVGRVVSSGLGSIRIPVAGFGLLSGMDTSLDWRVALYTAAVSLATALLFGLAPAVESSRVALLPAMQEAASGSLRRARIRSAFIVVQFAASAALLVTGAVFVYHMIGLDLIDPGFETDGVFVVRDPTEPRLQNEDERRAVVEGLAARLAAQEGIQASLARDAPLNFSGLRLRIELEDGSELAASGTEVSEGHFDTLGIRLLGGRSFEASDRLGIPAVAVVNETLAERLWPGEPPLGRRFRQILPEDRPGPWVEVIGLATDSKYVDLLEDPTPFVYLPLPATGTRMPSILLRTELSEDQARALVQTELQALDPRLPVPQVRPVDALMDLSYFGFRVLSVLGSVMGTLALLLASIGTFGVVAYLATQRRLEIGICLTLGATQGRIVRRISGPMLLWSTVGIGVGSVLTAGVLRILPVMNGPIGETPFVVPIALVAATVLLTVCAFLAGTLPALQAVRNDPIQALRN